VQVRKSMLREGVEPSQRYTGKRRCPVCNGAEWMRRGQGIRCWGYLRAAGGAICTRVPSEYPDGQGGWFHPPTAQGFALDPRLPLLSGLGQESLTAGLFKGWPAFKAALDRADEAGFLLGCFHSIFESRCVIGHKGCAPGFLRGRSGRWRYSCPHVPGGKPGEYGGNVGLVDAYAASITRTLRELPKTQYGRWAARLLRDAERVHAWTYGAEAFTLPDPGVNAVELPPEATSTQRDLYRDILELFACAWLIDSSSPVALSRRFLHEWSRVSWAKPSDVHVESVKRCERELGRLRHDFDALRRYGAIEKAGEIQTGKRACAVWLPVLPVCDNEPVVYMPEEVFARV
jgi:hypothetical protein